MKKKLRFESGAIEEMKTGLVYNHFVNVLGEELSGR